MCLGDLYAGSEASSLSSSYGCSLSSVAGERRQTPRHKWKLPACRRFKVRSLPDHCAETSLWQEPEPHSHCRIVATVGHTAKCGAHTFVRVVKGDTHTVTHHQGFHAGVTFGLPIHWLRPYGAKWCRLDRDGSHEDARVRPAYYDFTQQYKVLMTPKSLCLGSILTRLASMLR